MYRTNVVALLGTLLLSVVCGAAGRSTGTTQLSSNEMAIELYGGYLAVARGGVNNADNLRFLLDTGASNTAIDRRVAERLGLHGQSAKVINFDKNVAVEWTEVQELTFGPERIRNVRVLIEDFGYLRSSGLHVDGVIGLDQLRSQSFLVDYARERVMFGPIATGGLRGVPMRADAKLIRVEVELDAQPVWLVADTGARGIVLYEDTIKDLLVNYRVEGRTGAASLGGPLENRVAIVPRLRLGGQDLDREVVLVSAPGAKRLSGVSGYLGLASLDAKQVAFSFETNQLLWKK
ncbi:MAG: retroviral-like aspartic protease family protein [Candidatus Acidiferrales bacterium]